MSDNDKVLDPKQIVQFFDDVEASDVITLAGNQITAPMVSGANITTEETFMGGGVRVVMYIFDRSPSMEPVARMFWEDFNAELIPAIQDARQDDIAALRIGGISFSSGITAIWERDMGPGKAPEYFHMLEDVPPLTKAEYNPAKGWGTALHKAILDGYARALAYALTIMNQTGIMPEIDVIVLSDGADTDDPSGAPKVRQVVQGSKPGLVRFVFFYFETSLGLRDPMGYAINDLGFNGENVIAFAKLPNETDKERASRFRRMMRVMSKVSASKNTSAVKAIAAVIQEDDDVV